MISTEVKVIFIVIVLLLWASSAGYCPYEGVQQGRAEVIQSDVRAIREQAGRDAKVAERVKNGYESEIARLRADAALQPAPVSIRLCKYPRGSGSAPTVAGGTQPPSSAGGGVPEVPESPVAGPDIGPELQQLALRADELSAQVRALLSREMDL